MSLFPAFLRPSRSVPLTRWRSDRRWTGKPSTLAVLILGLWLFGTGEALLVIADLGVGPWTVLAQGVSSRTPLDIGEATFVISLVVLLAWIPLRERLGLGTIANAIVIATALQVMSSVIPHPDNPVVRIGAVLLGIALVGLGSGLYLTTNLGPGPRDGMMTGIHYRIGWPVAGVRLGIEVTVLVIGWFLGGTVGLGTVLFALLIGPFVGYGLKIVGTLAGAKEVVETIDEPELDA
ncbi:MAG: YitT family protein [Candidatus Nanopelagicales bacterium]|nr:YitT family protein [Candidatus Nanopelagicales bacterium]MCF8539324.1 YitT family protein [Candidatus Nanopelagicales bacterium]MCF8550931.1 YitT family protein [Candidatus Nanopelagicales bacterium]